MMFSGMILVFVVASSGILDLFHKRRLAKSFYTFFIYCHKEAIFAENGSCYNKAQRIKCNCFLKAYKS